MRMGVGGAHAATGQGQHASARVHGAGSRPPSRLLPLVPPPLLLRYRAALVHAPSSHPVQHPPGQSSWRHTCKE